MRVPLKHIALLLSLVTTQYAIADLPQDADRGIDVELAGFLYSQGVYKTVYGSFRALAPETTVDEVESQNELVIPRQPGAKNGQIEAWLNKSNETIPVGVFFHE